ncbi:MAG: NACHT domain-containing protein, partial [Candidatus Omnitrophica bacterium]|nr:NACHT domain-containing protein [Candidatus Omnitrophota bacterium]
MDEFFIPPHIVDPGKSEYTETSTETIGIWDALFRSPRIILVGKVGTGKSTLLRYLALRFARNEMPAGYVRRMTFAHHATPVDKLLPVYIPLQEFGAGSGDLLDYASGSFAHYGFPNAKNFLLRKLRESQCLLLIDGLDETEDQRVAEGVSRFVTGFPRNQVIVAMRHIPEGCHLPDFTVLELIGFNEKERESFAQKAIGARSSTFVTLIQALERNEGLRRLGSAPLLLSSMILRGTQGPSPLHLGPLYEACLQTLLVTWPETRHLSTSASLDPALQEVIVEELASLLHRRQWDSLPRDEMLAALQEATLAVEAPAISPEDLLNSLVTQSGILRRKPDGSYSFMDCALQKYLTARKATREGKVNELATRASDPWWQDVIILAAGLSRDASEIIHLIQQRMTDTTEALFLNGQCLPDAPDTGETVRDKIIS